MTSILSRFNPNTIKEVFNADISYFETLGEVRTNDKGKRHIFIDNGASILAVGHLDVVNDYTHFHVLDDFADMGQTVLSTRVDDRLGVYVILHILHQFGLKYDILLCEDEEKGQSTAQDFTSDKQYNWMFEFDRRRNDAVTYGYGGTSTTGKEWDALLKESFEIGNGSASDISKLEHLKCKAVNVGAGYEDEHDETARFYPWMTAAQIGQFIGFYYKHCTTYFPHEKKVYAPPTTHYHYQAPVTVITVPHSDIHDEGPFDEDDHWSRNRYTGIQTWRPDPNRKYRDEKEYPDRYPTHCKLCEHKLDADSCGMQYMGICNLCENYIIHCIICDESMDLPMGASDADKDSVVWFCVDCMDELDDETIQIITREELERRKNDNANDTPTESAPVG